MQKCETSQEATECKQDATLDNDTTSCTLAVRPVLFACWEQGNFSRTHSVSTVHHVTPKKIPLDEFRCGLVPFIDELLVLTGTDIHIGAKTRYWIWFDVNGIPRSPKVLLMARTAELPERSAKNKLRRFNLFEFGSYSPKYVWSTTSWDSVQLCGQNYRGITNTGSCQLIKWKNDRKEVGADLLTALHVMLQPGCHSWKRQLLSPNPAHSNHQGHPKKPCECNSHVFMCDSQTDGSTSACWRNPTSVCSNGEQHSPAHLILPNLSLLPCLPQKTYKKPEPKHGTIGAIQLQWGPNAYSLRLC